MLMLSSVKRHVSACLRHLQTEDGISMPKHVFKTVVRFMQYLSLLLVLILWKNFENKIRIIFV